MGERNYDDTLGFWASNVNLEPSISGYFSVSRVQPPEQMDTGPLRKILGDSLVCTFTEILRRPFSWEPNHLFSQRVLSLKRGSTLESG